MADATEFQRRIRRRFSAAGLSADVVADVNVAVSTGGGTAHVEQRAPIRQGRPGRARRTAPDPKEHP